MRSLKNMRVARLNLIKDTLSNIRTIVETITRNTTETAYRKEIAKQLHENGYDYFNGGKSTEAAHVIRILALAINDNLVEKFDLQRLKTENRQTVDVEELGDKLNVEGSVDDSLLKNRKGMWSSLATAKSPITFAKFLKKNGSDVFVRRLIEHQYDIKWATDNKCRRPEPFNFYEFCDNQQSMKYLKYKPRTAHTKVTLYQESFKKSPQDFEISKEELCPDIYMNTTENGWRKIKINTDRTHTLPTSCNLAKDLKWMNSSIREFISTEADKINHGDYEASLDEKMVYLAVIEDMDFQKGNELKLDKISKCQGYVGKANKGILGRWLGDSGSHCEMMKRCLHNVNAMTTYDPIRLQGIQLVDVRLALGKVRKEKCALFVMKTFGDEEERAKISLDKARKKFVEAKDKRRAENTELCKLKKELKIAQRRFDKAKAEAKGEAKAKAKAEAIDNLKKQEEKYRDGISLPGKDEKWYLKDMKFGMNNK